MHKIFLDCYFTISILIAMIDVILAVNSIQKNNPMGRYLGLA